MIIRWYDNPGNAIGTSASNVMIPCERFDSIFHISAQRFRPRAHQIQETSNLNQKDNAHCMIGDINLNTIDPPTNHLCPPVSRYETGSSSYATCLLSYCANILLCYRWWDKNTDLVSCVPWIIQILASAGKALCDLQENAYELLSLGIGMWRRWKLHLGEISQAVTQVGTRAL